MCKLKAVEKSRFVNKKIEERGYSKSNVYLKDFLN